MSIPELEDLAGNLLLVAILGLVILPLWLVVWLWGKLTSADY